MNLSLSVLLSGILLSAAAYAEAPADAKALEKNKAKIVSRLYQVTYGQTGRCKQAPAEIAEEFNKEMTRFVETNDKLMQQVKTSRYYEPARQKFSKHEAIDPKKDTPEALGRECKYLVQILQSMNDTPEGKKSVKEYEEILSK